MSTTKNIILDRTGIRRVGKYVRGRIYRDVPADEAERLIKVKGFRLATKADEDAAAKSEAGVGKPTKATVTDAPKDNQAEG